MVSKLLTDCVNTNCAFSSAEVSCIAVLYSFRTLELLWGSSFFFLYLFIYLFKSQKFPRMEEEEALGG